MVAETLPRAKRLPLTSRRQSQLILETTAVVVSLTLLAWLLLWFVRKQPKASPVETIVVSVSGIEVPFQRTDARFLASDPNLANEVPLEGLKGQLRKSARGSGQSKVIHLSVPAIGWGLDSRLGGVDSDTTVREVIEELASIPNIKVLLALDVAQVGSDRELGVFGNAPYQGLASALKSVKVAEGTSLWVLSSCVAGETSLVDEDSGHSLFAGALHYALREIPKQSFKVKELASQVAWDVEWAARKFDTRQTPQLAWVGSAPPDDFSVLCPRVNPGPSRGEAEQPTAKEAPVKAEADPRQSLAKGLTAEWVEHDKLKRDAVRAAPSDWRFYEESLLRAERLVREAWRSSGEVTQASRRAQTALGEAGNRRREAQSRLNDHRKARDAFEFHPVMDDDYEQGQGRELLRQALWSVTGQQADQSELPRAPGAVEAQEKEPIWPLREEQYFKPYLELQFPAWCRVYQTTFRRDFLRLDSKDDELRSFQRPTLVKRTTLERRAAESALSLVDRRTLEWIRPSIEAGDRTRREVQDQLFAPVLEATTLEKQINTFAGHYGDAYKLARLARDARVALAESLYQLPHLAEWWVRTPDGQELNRPGGLPLNVDKALKAIETLTREVDKPPPASPGPRTIDDRMNELQTALSGVAETMDTLERGFEEARIRSEQAEDLQSIDRDLRVASIPQEERVSRLEWLRGRPIRPGDHAVRERSPSADGDPPRFWIEALGLAMLDARLRVLGQVDSQTTEGVKAGEMIRTLNELWTMLATPSLMTARAEELTKAFQVLEGVTREVQEVRRTLGANVFERVLASGEDTFERPSAIRLVPWRAAGDLERVKDQAEEYVARLETSHYPILREFHGDRLSEDYAWHAVPTRTRRPYSRGLRPETQTKPSSGEWRVKNDLTLPMAIGAVVDQGGRVPPGRAILGVRLDVDPQPPAQPNGPAEIPFFLGRRNSSYLTQPLAVGEGPEQNQSGTVSFSLNQGDRRTTAIAWIEAALFYRGHVLPDQAEARRLAQVQPYREGERPVTLALRLDPEPLRNRYRDWAPGGGTDPVVDVDEVIRNYDDKHLGKRGYTRFGRPFEFRLEIRNQWEREWMAYVHLALVDQAGKELVESLIPKPDANLTLPNPNQKGGPRFLSGEIKPDKISEDPDTTFLRVRVYEVNQPILPGQPPPKQDPVWEERFPIQQVRQLKFFTFEQKPVDFVLIFDDRGRPVGRTQYKCYYVHINRSGDDPITEPFPPNELVVRLQCWRTDLMKPNRPREIYEGDPPRDGGPIQTEIRYPKPILWGRGRGVDIWREMPFFDSARFYKDEPYRYKIHQFGKEIVPGADKDGDDWILYRR